MYSGHRHEFWRYSSRNRAGHERQPRVSVRRDIILNLWAGGMTMDSIALRVKLDVYTVRNYLRRARRQGDPRATIRHTATLKALGAKVARDPQNPFRSIVVEMSE